MEPDYSENKEKKQTTVELRPLGPVVIKGDFVLVDEDGNEHVNKTIVSVCRCGRSQKMPWCDGSHK